MKRIACMATLFGYLILASTALGSPLHPEEQYKQALGFLLGNNRSQSDQDDALRLLRSAADSGYAPAETGLATVYDAGSLVARDVQQAVRWYTKTAQQGDWIAAFSLGRLYFLGDGVPQDTAMAKK